MRGEPSHSGECAKRALAGGRKMRFRRVARLVHGRAMRRIHVELGPRSYPVLVGSGLLRSLGELLRGEGLRQTNAFVITNPQVGALYFPSLETALRDAGFTAVVRHDI